MKLNIVDKKSLENQDFNQEWNKERDKIYRLYNRLTFSTTFHCCKKGKNKNK